MICKVLETIEKHCLLDNVKTVCVGVSGGADSMCLLHILSSLKEKYGITLKAVHINHNLRGEEALRDESLVRDYCEEMDIELEVFSVNVADLSEKLGLGTEECGRRVRYECFDKMGCDAVAVAHSLSDSIETVVYNLLRGTGTKGLCGIPVRREPNIIRPLAACTREEIEGYCRNENVPFITDSSNLTDDYTRNYIRHNIIPAFGKVNSSFESSIMRSCSILDEENDFIEKSAHGLILKAEANDGYDCEILMGAHSALRKRAVHFLLSDRMKKPPLYKHTELVNSVIEKGQGSVEIATDTYASVIGGRLVFTGAAEKILPWEVAFADGIAETAFGTYRLKEQSLSGKEHNAFDADKVKNELMLTSRREGDRFTFKNRGITKSLKKLFNEMKIPVCEREKMAVIRDGENIVWVEGVGVNADYIPCDNTKNIIVIKKDG